MLDDGGEGGRGQSDGAEPPPPYKTPNPVGGRLRCGLPSPSIPSS